jgi:hypothetical protein
VTTKTARPGALLLAAALLSTAAPSRGDEASPAGARAAAASDADKDKAAPADKEKAASPDEPELRYPPPSTRWKVISAGLVVTGIAWGIGFACAQAYPYVDPSLQPTMPTATTPLIPSGPPEGPMLRIPVVGPWAALGKMGCASDETECGVKMGLRAAAYVIDGIVQLGGLALITEGIVMKTESAAPKASALAIRRGGFEVKPVPMVTPTMSGVGFVGTF